MSKSYKLTALDRKVSAVELVAGASKRRMFVFSGPDGMPLAEVLAATGAEPRKDDLLVYLRDFAASWGDVPAPPKLGAVHDIGD